MSQPNVTRRFLTCTVALGVSLASGCSGLLPKGTPPPLVYALDGARHVGPSISPAGTAPSLIINPTRAAPGYDSQHIVYVRVPHQLEHFARSDWVDTPARMLAPLIVSAVESAGGFGAVGPATSGIAGDLRLDTEVLRLQHEFGGGPSRVRFTLRATMSDNATRRVISWREFDEAVSSESEDPYGGVIAANRAVQLVMAQLAQFCTLASEPWRESNRVDPEPAEHNHPAR
jgi:cholesterol transport system auxiliary component